MRLLILLALAALGCGPPDLHDGYITCGADPDCPPGFECGCNGKCYRRDALPACDGPDGPSADGRADAAGPDAAPPDGVADARPPDARLDGGPPPDGTGFPDAPGPMDGLTIQDGPGVCIGMDGC